LQAWKQLKVHFLGKQTLGGILKGTGQLGRRSAKQSEIEAEWLSILPALHDAGFCSICRLTTSAPARLELGEYLFDVHTRFWANPPRPRSIRVGNIDHLTRQARKSGGKAGEFVVEDEEIREGGGSGRELIYQAASEDPLFTLLVDCVCDRYRSESGPPPGVKEGQRRQQALQLGAKRMITKLSAKKHSLSKSDAVRNVPKPFTDWFELAVNGKPRPTREALLGALIQFRSVLDGSGGSPQ
jgi:hypothetical protein